MGMWQLLVDWCLIRKEELPTFLPDDLNLQASSQDRNVLSTSLGHILAMGLVF